MPPLRQESQRISFPYKYLAICIALFLITTFIVPLVIPKITATTTHDLLNETFKSSVPQCQPSLNQFSPSTTNLSLGLTQTNSTLICPSTLPNSELGKTDTNQSIQVLATASDNGESIVSLLLQSRLWPQIHEYARLAKVPVMMYHDILPDKQVFFDVTPEELAADFELIKAKGLTPITLEQLVLHLQTGVSLPEKPILLTFDDGYEGHYLYVYPLLRQYSYPAVFSIYYNKVEQRIGRSSLNWEQAQEMANDPLVTIAGHSMTHPEDLSTLSDGQLIEEIIDSKRLLEERLGITIRYFTYPAGRFDDRVRNLVTEAGYQAALAMDENEQDEHFAGESKDLLEIGRFGQSRLEEIVDLAWGGSSVPRYDGGFNFTTAVRKEEYTVGETSLILISGGRPNTIHADSRYQIPDIIKGTDAVAAVDGGFFSLKSLDSNIMIGPVLSQNEQIFIPGYEGEIPKLTGRPLVLIGPDQVKFIPFDPNIHNTLPGILTEMPSTTDAFVAAAWLVKDAQPQTAETFSNLYSFDVARNRAFWGINLAGQPVIGVTKTMIDSVALGEILHQLGFRDAIMVDSGASTSLAYQGKSLVEYTPRPVPHAIALFEPYSVSNLDIEKIRPFLSIANLQ